MYLSRISALLCIFSFGHAFQQIAEESLLLSSGIYKPILNKKIEELKILMDDEFMPAVSSIQEASNNLNAVIEDINLRKAEFHSQREEFSLKLAGIAPHCLSEELQQHSLSLLKWDFSQCGNFTEDLQLGVKLVMNGSVIAAKIGFTVAGIVNDAIHCPSVNVFSAYKCVIRNIDDAKDLINYTKSVVPPLYKDIVQLSKKLPVAFNLCMGKTANTHAKLHQSLNEAQCF